MSIDYRPDNTIVFTLARMNPPTPGHLYLIEQLIDAGIDKNVEKVYVILSKTNDNNENPISCPEKISVLGTPEDVANTMINSAKNKMINSTTDEDKKNKIRNIQVECLCVPDVPRATPFTPLVNIAKEKATIPDLNFFIVIGDDRENMRDSVADYFFKWDNVKSIDGKILPRPNMTELKSVSSSPEAIAQLNIQDILTNNIGAVSASFVRNLVKNNARDKFVELYTPYLDESKIPVLYEEILEGLNLPPNTKPESKPKLKGYSYPMIKGQISEVGTIRKRKINTVGGRKTRKTKKNKRKTKKNKHRYSRRK